MPRVSIENIHDIDATTGYKLSDYGWDVAGEYYGYLNSEGYWFIMYDTGDTITYVKGVSNSGYVANWAVRETLDYDTYDVVF